MTDEATKRSDRIKYAIAAGAVATGIVGGEIVDRLAPEPAYLEYLPPPLPPATAPEHPKGPGPDEWPNIKHKDDGRKLRMLTPLDTVDEPRWVMSKAVAARSKTG